MKILDIQSYPLSADLNRSIGFSQSYYHKKNNLLLKVTTEDGTIGWGECYGPNLAIAAAVDFHFKPLLIGRNPLHHEQLWNFMWRTFHDFNRSGIFMAAISGLDIAFWDLKGKTLQIPLRTLLGGTDGPIPCYATGMYYRDDKNESGILEELLEEATRYLSEGYDFIKVKIGKNVEFDRELVYKFRESFPNTKIAADANHAYNFKEATSMAKLLESLDYSWLEEPLAPDNIEEMASLRLYTSLPIAAGECEQTRHGFQRLARAGSLDIYQPDIAYCGGITEFQKISAIAAAAHVDVVPHCWGLKVNQAAAASAISILPENPGRYERRPIYLEVDRTEHPVRDSIFSEAHTVKNGKLYFNNSPGLGVDVDESAMARYIIDAKMSSLHLTK